MFCFDFDIAPTVKAVSENALLSVIMTGIYNKSVRWKQEDILGSTLQQNGSKFSLRYWCAICDRGKRVQ